MRLAAGAASGTRGGGGGLTGFIAGGTGFGSGCGAECGAACGFAAGSATGRGLCGCGEDNAAPGACRGRTAVSGDDFTVAAGAAGAFDGTFTIDCVVCAFATGFAAGGGLATDTLGDEGDGADDGHIATMALFALVIPWRSHDMRPGFCAGAFATTLAAGGFGVVLATGCAFATGFAEGWAFA